MRALFQRCLLGVASPVVRATSLWRLWLCFERDVLRRLVERHAHSISKHAKRAVDKQAQQLKQVFLDGLRMLPWMKEWVLLGLETFDGDEKDAPRWEFAELRRVYNVLQERELRVRNVQFEASLDELATRGNGQSD